MRSLLPLLLLSPCLSLRVPRRAAVLRSLGALSAPFLLPPPSHAAALQEKQRNLSPAALSRIVRDDLVERQFLATADFTRSIYDEAAVFTDEIDSYTLPKFIAGTQALFVRDKSHVDLVGEIEADERRVGFRFDEVLCFNVPLRPRVRVTGRVELVRGPDGLITSYREFWDKSPLDVLKTATFR